MLFSLTDFFFAVLEEMGHYGCELGEFIASIVESVKTECTRVALEGTYRIDPGLLSLTVALYFVRILLTVARSPPHIFF